MGNLDVEADASYAANYDHDWVVELAAVDVMAADALPIQPAMPDVAVASTPMLASDVDRPVDAS